MTLASDIRLSLSKVVDSHAHDGHWIGDYPYRLLAGSTEGLVIDYTVFSVLCWTLTLLLFVEFLRHRLDVSATGRPFFTAVLDSVYQELSTLGIVEFWVFLLHTYYDDLNLEAEAVFAKVHFMLFTTAILNALMSVLLAISSSRISQRMWVQAEELEINHYLSVRKEFYLISRQLGILSGTNSNVTEIDDNVAPSMSRILKHPILSYRYNKLLVPVRFHELRLHFLQANNLPNTFRVSTYLKRSEVSVFVKMSHISVGTWLSVMAISNLFYYFLGIVLFINDSRNKKILEYTMRYGALAICLVVFFFSGLTLFKVKSIFYEIMHTDFIDFCVNGREVSHQNRNSRATGLRQSSHLDQLELFWFQSPQYIISAIQVMQFGYAITFAYFIIFSEVNTSVADLGSMPDIFLASIIFLTYVGFVVNISRVLPRYTLSTSLGQLVNQKRLSETLATFKLEEAIKRNKIQSAELKRNESAARWDKMSEMVAKDFQDLPKATASSKERKGRRTRVRSISDGVAAMRNFGKQDQEQGTFLKKLNPLISPPSRKEDRHRLRKTVSANVALMRSPPSVLFDKTKKDAKQTSTKKEEGGGPVAIGRIRSHAQLSSLIEDIPSRNVDHEEIDLDVGRGDSKEGSIFQKRLSDVNVQQGTNFNLELKNTTGADPYDSDGSDDNDIPDAEPSKQPAATPPPKVAEKLRSLFASKEFNVIDFVFGSMAIFFFIAMRLEHQLESGGYHKYYENTPEIPELLDYWMIVTWLSVFIVESGFLIILFWPIKVQYCGTDMIMASFFDLVLSITCLSLLLVAEVKRIANTRAEDIKPFGSNIGIDKMELFTSLIFLRIFRFTFGKWLHTAWLWYGMSLTREGDKDTIIDSSIRVKSRITVDEKQGQDHGVDSHGPKISDLKGTPVELWRKAVSLHPELVSKHGEFSSEILQVMLGVSIAARMKQPVDASGEGKTETNESISVTSPDSIGWKIPPPPRSPPSVPSNDHRYDDLSGLTKSVIIAGRIGKPVRSKSIIIDQSFPEVATDLCLKENFLSDEQEFERELQNDRAQQYVTFTAPNAFLIRSMKRCCRKLPPLLDHWVAVDVVMTMFEIVFFETENEGFDDDVYNSDDGVYNSGETSKEARAKQKVIQEALVATKGGKGLRLRDVALGRKVVGHLEVSDITKSIVQRHMPTGPFDVKNEDLICALTQEFWKPVKSSSSKKSPSWDTIDSWWEGADEDHLKITSVQGILDIRFFDDLIWCSRHKEEIHHDENDVSHKDNALQWCQTIVRLCGPDALSQDLPHFGDGVNELKDFLVVAGKNDDRLIHNPMKRKLSISNFLSRTLHNDGSNRHQRDISDHDIARSNDHEDTELPPTIDAYPTQTHPVVFQM